MKPSSTTSLLFAAVLAVTSLLGCAVHSASTPAVSSPSSPDTQGEAPPPDWAALAAERLPLLVPCELPNVPETLLCGTIEVPENRAVPDGRRLGLKVVVVPAQAEQPPDDPVFIFEGGPGGAATGRALGSVYAGPVRARDIVLVDQRGTGGSHPLDCALSEANLRPGTLREMFPTAEVRDCAAKLSADADLRFYTTDHFADDIEAVRQHLGYGPINVRGGSYGTSAMMVFAQRHPASTRTLFGIGSTSPLRSNMAERGVFSDRTLARLARLCAQDEACRALTPELDATTAAVLAKLEAGPELMELADPQQPDETLRIAVSRDWLAEQMRLLLYYAHTSRALPWAVHRAHEADDWGPLVTLALYIERSFRSSLARGVLLTVQCSEHMGFDTEEALARGAHTLVGNYRLRQQIQGCAAWPHEKKSVLGVAEPQILNIPTLFLSGALDPVTPPEYAEEAAAYFPNSRHLILPEGQHGPFDLEESWTCIHQIWADLLDRGSVEGLDATCTESIRRPPFVVDAEGFRTFVAESLGTM